MLSSPNVRAQGMTTSSSNLKDKPLTSGIRFVTGLGVEGVSHAGWYHGYETVTASVPRVCLMPTVLELIVQYSCSPDTCEHKFYQYCSSVSSETRAIIVPLGTYPGVPFV